VIIVKKASLFEEVVNQYSEKLQKILNQPISGLLLLFQGESKKNQESKGAFVTATQAGQH
jgi:hypothetical protein